MFSWNRYCYVDRNRVFLDYSRRELPRFLRGILFVTAAHFAVLPASTAARSWNATKATEPCRARSSARVALRRSCLSRYTDTASSTTSFIRNATFPTIAGNPPADWAQPSGIKGMIVTVHKKDATAPRAPRTPNFLFQNPASNNAPNSHSEMPRK